MQKLWYASPVNVTVVLSFFFCLGNSNVFICVSSQAVFHASLQNIFHVGMVFAYGIGKFVMGSATVRMVQMSHALCVSEITYRCRIVGWSL